LITNISGTDQAIDKRKTALATTIFFHVRRKQFGRLWSTDEKLTFDLWRWNSLGSCGCRGTCSYKISSSWVSGSWVIVLTSFFALSRNAEKSDHLVVTLTLTFDLW